MIYRRRPVMASGSRKNWRKRLTRIGFLLHRWLGLSLGAMMLIWCLSGIVMLYKPWPQPDLAASLRAHEMLHLDRPVHLPNRNDRFRAMRLVMAGDMPVLQLFQFAGKAESYDLLTGQPVLSGDRAALTSSRSPKDLEAIARRYASPDTARTELHFRGLRWNDQWILDTKGHEAGFYRFDFEDGERTSLYLTPDTGDVVQATTKRIRFWTWLGAIPHWLYPSLLRRYPSLWADIVILLSATGIALTMLGLWIGLRRLKAGRSISPYRGIHLAHHILGLALGVFLLSWISSGFLTMTPGGLMAQQPPSPWMDRLAGSVSLSDLAPALSLLRDRPMRYREISVLPLAGYGFVVTIDRSGSRERLDARLARSPLDRAAIGRAAQMTGLTAGIERLDSDDAYYFSTRHQNRLFPVWRVTASNGSILYLDAIGGAALLHLDRSDKSRRWVVYGPHDLDFLPWLRRPAARLFILVPLLTGLAVLCLTGLGVGMMRLRFMTRSRARAALRRSQSHSATGNVLKVRNRP